MLDIHSDFETYLSKLMHARRRTLIYLVFALVMALAFSLLCVLLANNFRIPELQPLMDIIPDVGFLSQFVNPQPYSSWNNALGTALFGIQIAITSLLRYWYLRQDKLLTLLTQALVIEQQTEFALRLMLTRRIA